MEMLARLRVGSEETLRKARSKSQKYWNLAEPHLQRAMLAAKEALRAAQADIADGSKQAAMHLGKARVRLADFGRRAASRAVVARHEAEKYWNTARTGTQRAMIAANQTMGALRVEAAFRSRQAAVQLEKAQHALADAGRSTAARVGAARRGLENELDRVEASLRNAAVATTEKLTSVGSGVSDAAGRTAASMAGAGRVVASAVKNVIEKPRRLREARRAKEEELRELLVASGDGIVVTDDSRRLVVANSLALEMLGISEFNMRQFTIDAFVEHADQLAAERNGSTIEADETSRKQRKIRRLDGGLRLADCEYAAEFVPKRHVYTFRNIGPYRLAPFGVAGRRARTNSGGNVQAKAAPFPRVAQEAKKLPRHGVRPVV